MKLKSIIAGGITAFLFAQAIQAQNVQYDPLLDPAVKIPVKPTISESGEYLWYPGQLSAHLQQQRLKESKERCVNVGYPGKFYAPVFKTYFRKEVKLSAETKVEWQSTGIEKVYVDGIESNNYRNSLQLSKGKSILLFEVKTENNLPSIKVTLNNKIDVDGWQASLDGAHWNFAETSPIFGTSGKMPLDDPEIDVVVSPVNILPVRNAIVEKDKAIIHKNGYVLIDFFHLEVGKISFIAKGKGKLTAIVGESPEEALNENSKFFEQQPVEPYELSDNETLITLPERAVRYLKLFCDEGCEVSSIQFIAKIWPVDIQMSFECDNERINNIWNASVATVHTSMHGFYLDGIKRDYLPWSMDAVLCSFGGEYVFSDKQV